MLVNTTGQLIGLIGAISVFTFFLLSTGDDLLNRILHVLPNQDHRARVLATTREVQDSIGGYLSQITMINIVLGIAAGLVMRLLGMPTPLLWGARATTFNFVPYVGPLMATAIVFVAAA